MDHRIICGKDGTSCLLPVVTKSVRRDGWQNSGAKKRAARKLLHVVIAGLDPAIHAEVQHD
jgi:hypothetical protein